MRGGDKTTGSIILAPTQTTAVPLTIQQLAGSNANMFTMMNSGGTTIGGVNSNLVAYGNIAGDVCTGRLTLSSTDPCPIGDIGGASGTTIYYLPYNGRGMVTLYNTGGYFETFALPPSGLSISAAPCGTNYNVDVFIYNTLGGGGGTLGLGLIGWASDTTRATALLNFGNYFYPTGQPQQRYIGTVRSSSVSGQITDSSANRYVWNMHNRHPRPIYKGSGNYSDTTSTSTNAARFSNNSVNNCRIDFVIGGVKDTSVELAVYAIFALTGAAAQWMGSGYAFNGSTSVLYPCTQLNATNIGAIGSSSIASMYAGLAPGYNYVSAIDVYGGSGAAGAGYYWYNLVLTGTIMA